jgi:DNA-binding LacI/PurR family transcriptional regulator/serine phosphatase RsbU (regulator of sigma subunit)
VTNRTPTIAILVDYMVSSYQAGLIRAVERASKAKGVSLLILAGRALHAPSAGDATQNKIYELLKADNVDGIILVAGCMSCASGAVALSDYCARYRPIPVCSIGVELQNVPSLIISNEQGSRAIVEHLIECHGAKRFAYIGGPAANREAADRYAGYVAALTHHGLVADDNLVEHGDFTMPAGVAAMKEILLRSTNFDAVVAANDYMAIGATEALRNEGLRVPDDVLIVGFDDAPFSRFALPSLTTVRQPLDAIARKAVDWLTQAAAGQPLPAVAQIDVDLVTRQSCGCGLISTRRYQTLPPENSRQDTALAIIRHREPLLHLLHTNVGVPPETFAGWAGRLLDALHAELTSSPGRFLTVLNALLEEAQPHSDFVDELSKVVSLLRGEVRRLRPLNDVALELEHLWHGAQIAVGNAATNAQGREKIELQVVIDAVRVGFERVGTALSRPTLRQAILGMLPDVAIRRASISLLDEEKPNRLVPFVTVIDGSASLIPGATGFPVNELVPPGFFRPERHAHVMLPLSFESDFFGIMVMEYTTNETVYGLLRDHISSALKGGMLHRNALRQAALRERAERDHLDQEAKIAERIQTAILPRAVQVDGFEIATKMLPAADVGGDYYDTIPFANGCWVGIGDVTGHGLVAGLIMLMLQGMVAAMIQREPNASPSEIVTSLNRSLYENIRNRLSRDDHVTFTLLRCDRDGRVTLAGVHEDIVVWRAKSCTVETMRAPGFWTGALPDVSDVTADGVTQLEIGDLLVLYTDGVTEAMNELGEQFELARLCHLVAAEATLPADVICGAIVNAVEQWQARQIDDISVVVIRYTGNGYANV